MKVIYIPATARWCVHGQQGRTDCISYIKEAYQNNYFDIAKSNLSTEEVNSFKNSDYVAIMSNSQYNPVRKDEYSERVVYQSCGRRTS